MTMLCLQKFFWGDGEAAKKLGHYLVMPSCGDRSVGALNKLQSTGGSSSIFVLHAYFLPSLSSFYEKASVSQCFGRIFSFHLLRICRLPQFTSFSLILCLLPTYNLLLVRNHQAEICHKAPHLRTHQRNMTRVGIEPISFHPQSWSWPL